MKSVVLFYTGETPSNATRYVKTLARNGYELRACSSSAALRAGLHKALSQAKKNTEPVFAVLAATSELNRSAASIFTAYPHIGVLVQLESCDNQALVATLQLGVDAWCPPICSAQTLVLLLHSLKRRLEFHHNGLAASRTCAAHANPLVEKGAYPGAWRLAENGWRFETPAGQCIRLTSAERHFLLALAKHPENSATHSELTLACSKPAQSIGVRKSRLSVLISRLRQKVEQNGETLPIRALHGQGYMFTGEMVLDVPIHALPR